MCPVCGEATPADIGTETGEAGKPKSLESDELEEYGSRLQRAIGDSYQLGQLIGKGGFGVVYAAWDAELHREVAVKALRPDVFPTPALLERFKREARAVARLRNPNVIPIYVVGEGEDIAYMIMPRIDGESLRSVLQREKRLSITEARRVLQEVGDALRAAHSAGIIHRDIKPHNILLEGRQRRALLMDFGIAKSIDSGESELTATGMIVGTPAYMSPEQKAGMTVDARSDIYSLGVVAYQTLVGSLPSEAQLTQDSHPGSRMHGVMHVRTLRSDTPRALAAAVMGCLPRNPDERWQTVDEFLSSLSGESTSRLRLRTASVVALSGLLIGFGYWAVREFRCDIWECEAPESRSSTAATSPEEPTATPAPLEGPDSSEATPPRQPVPPTRQSQQSQTPTQRIEQFSVLVVRTVGGWARIYVDGAFRREGTSHRDTLPPGTHTLRLERPGYVTVDTTITLEASETRIVRAQMNRGNQ